MIWRQLVRDGRFGVDMEPPLRRVGAPVARPCLGSQVLRATRVPVPVSRHLKAVQQYIAGLASELATVAECGVGDEVSATRRIAEQQVVLTAEKDILGSLDAVQISHPREVVAKALERNPGVGERTVLKV